MHGLSGLFKIAISGLVVVAAANGTEVVDVVEVIGDVTVHAQAIVKDVDVEAESVIPEQLAYSDPVGDNAVFARRGSESFGITERKAPEFAQISLEQLLALQDSDDQFPTNSATTTPRAPAPTVSAPRAPRSSPAILPPTIQPAPPITASPTSSPSSTTSTTSTSTSTTVAPTTSTTTSTSTTVAPTTSTSTSTSTTVAPTTTTMP